MAGNTKKFLSDKITDPITTTLRETILITGSIVSGTYAEPDGTGTHSNIKIYSHGMFQSVYDYPYASSSANHIFDLTAGYSTTSDFDGVTGEVSASKKNNLYNEMAQYLVGFDPTGSIERFDKDGDLTGGAKIDDILVLNLARLLSKDGIQKGTFELEMGVSGGIGLAAGYQSPFAERIKITDVGGDTNYKVNSPKGEYGILYANNSQGTPLDGAAYEGSATSTAGPCGLIYYQAGIAILSASMFLPTGSVPFGRSGGLMSGALPGGIGQPRLWHSASGFVNWDIQDTLTSGSINELSTGFRHRISNLSFNNQTNLTSVLYECDISTRDFNYSTNPTYLTGSKIRVKSDDRWNTKPKSFITTVGLYNAQRQLLAVGKLSKPIEKSPAEDITIKVRLDY